MVEPSKVKEAAVSRKNENIKFRAFLKNRADADELDSHFLSLHNELFADYDCRKCANCCREFSTAVQTGEIAPAAAFLDISEKDFIEKHLVQDEDGYELKAPCLFLGDNGECRIQDVKPSECKSFPHTGKPERLWSMLSVLSFADVCPIVFEILERLKKIYRFRPRL
jgi:Fe-S-cluster containining protein